MNIEIITLPKQKSWGAVDDPYNPGHFYTGYDGLWEAACAYDWNDPRREEWWAERRKIVPPEGSPAEAMTPCRNAIITGDFKIDSMSRGRSAANFSGHFKAHESVEYTFGMSGILELLQLIQTGVMSVCDGHISGRWTLAKQGRSLFLKPYTGA